MPQPTFFYDFNSSYAYLAASRIDRVLPGPVRWQPIAFGAMVVELGFERWSFGDGRAAGIAECERRARAYGLPELRWPDGWPVDCYSLLPLRAALVAEDHGLLRAFSDAAFERFWVDGVALSELETVLLVAASVGLDPEAVREGVASTAIKDRLRAATAEALDAGVQGVPTVLVDGERYWGDDRLEDAAAVMSF